MPIGWLIIHRELMDKPIWKGSTPEQKVVLMTLLMMVDFKPNEWEWKGEKYQTKPGEKVTSIKSIADAAGKGISTQNVRSSLKRFEKMDFLTNESTKQGRLISIINWDLYQQAQQSTQQSTQQRPNKGPTPNEQRNKTTNKQEEPLKPLSPPVPEPEKKKAPRKVFKPPTVEEVAAYCTERKNTVDPEAFVNFYESKGWVVGRNKMKSWQAAVRTWEKNSFGKKQFSGGKSTQRTQTQTFDDLVNEDLKERIGEYQNGGKQERSGDGYEIFLGQGAEGPTEY